MDAMSMGATARDEEPKVEAELTEAAERQIEGVLKEYEEGIRQRELIERYELLVRAGARELARLREVGSSYSLQDSLVVVIAHAAGRELEESAAADVARQRRQYREELLAQSAYENFWDETYAEVGKEAEEEEPLLFQPRPTPPGTIESLERDGAAGEVPPLTEQQAAAFRNKLRNLVGYRDAGHPLKDAVEMAGLSPLVTKLREVGMEPPALAEEGEVLTPSGLLEGREGVAPDD